MGNNDTNSPVHPRNEYGRLCEKGVMALTEEERQELLNYLESEEYVPYNGFHISKRKIEAVLQGLYKSEIKACEILKTEGFDVYLLDEQYTTGSKADTFFEKNHKQDFMELKK